MYLVRATTLNKLWRNQKSIGELSNKIVSALRMNLGERNNNENIINVGPDKQDEPVIDRTAFAKGADVSWLTTMESEGHSFYHRHRVEKACIKLLYVDLNVNSIRLAVLVTPGKVWNHIVDVWV